jgi:hypothetical protein
VGEERTNTGGSRECETRVTLGAMCWSGYKIDFVRLLFFLLLT